LECLNESSDGAGAHVFKPWDQRTNGKVRQEDRPKDNFISCFCGLPSIEPCMFFPFFSRGSSFLQLTVRRERRRRGTLVQHSVSINFQPY
jgi:hypothetical protein